MTSPLERGTVKVFIAIPNGPVRGLNLITTIGYEPSIANVIAWLNLCSEQVPAEAITTLVEIESVDGYEGDHYVEVSVSYLRPETDEEMAARLAELRERLQREISMNDLARRRAQIVLDQLNGAGPIDLTVPSSLKPK